MDNSKENGSEWGVVKPVIESPFSLDREVLIGIQFIDCHLYVTEGMSNHKLVEYHGVCCKCECQGLARIVQLWITRACRRV